MTRKPNNAIRIQTEAAANVALDDDTRRACNNPDCCYDFGHVETCSDGTHLGQKMLLVILGNLEQTAKAESANSNKWRRFILAIGGHPAAVNPEEMAALVIMAKRRYAERQARIDLEKLREIAESPSVAYGDDLRNVCDSLEALLDEDGE